MDNKILIGAAAGVGLYLLAAKDKKAPAPTPPPTEPNNIPSLPPDLTIISGLVEVINKDSIPNYNNWKRAEWSAFYKDIYLFFGHQNAAVQIWSAWDNPNNPFLDNITSREALILTLISYREPEVIANNGFVIDADSQPIYETWTNEYNGQPSWDCEHWKIWFEKNVVKYGQTKASEKFRNAWTYADNWGWVWKFTAGQSCGIDCDFINYFREEGIDVANTGAENICTLVAVTTNLIDATEDVSETIKNTASMGKMVIPVLAIGAIAFVVISNAKKLS